MWNNGRNSFSSGNMTWANLENLEKISNYISPGERPFYTEFYGTLKIENPNIGLDGVIINSKYTFLLQNMEDIISDFDFYYKFREIGSETVERFQFNLQRRTNEIAQFYDTMFKLYSDVDILSRGRKIDTDTGVDIQENKTDNSSVDTTYDTNNKEVYQDTPVTPLGVDEYATNITDTTNRNTGEMTTSKTQNNTISRNTTQNMITHDSMAIEEVTKILENYKQTIFSFIKEYEICFINEIGKI